MGIQHGQCSRNTSPAPPPMDPPPAGAYRLDTAHSSLIVHVDHMGFSRYPVRFTRFDVEMDFDPQPGVPEVLAPGLRRVLAPNPSPMTFRGTNSFLVGEGRVALSFDRFERRACREVGRRPRRDLLV